MRAEHLDRMRGNPEPRLRICPGESASVMLYTTIDVSRQTVR